MRNQFVKSSIHM